MKRVSRECLCLALDNIEYETILHLADVLRDDIGCFKINSAFVRYGPGLVEALKKKSLDVFLDLKFHDIPATVAAHVRAAAGMGVDWLTVHASGGRDMLRAAVEAVPPAAVQRPRLLAVTVLTSLDRQALNDDLRVGGAVGEHVAHLAGCALDAGMDGMVCAAVDLPAFKDRLPPGFAKVTPGIGGPSAAAGSDQKRIADPVTAIRNGATMLVIGRSVLNAPDPSAAVRAIAGAIESA